MDAAMQSKKRKKRDKFRLSDLKELGHQLLSSRAHINNLPRLLTFVTPSSPPHYAMEAIVSLQSFFTPVLPELPPSSSKSKHATNSGQDDPEFIYRTWLRSKFDEFLKLLIDISVSPQCEETLREVSLDTIMDLAKEGNGGRFHSAIYHKLLHTIVYSELGIEILLDLLASKYFKYTDICYFTYISLEKLTRSLDTEDISDNKCSNSSGNNNCESRTRTELSIRKTHFILTHIPPIESGGGKNNFEMWNESGFDIKQENIKKHSKPLETEDKHRELDISKKMKLKFSKAWFAFLRLSLPVDVYKEVLVVLHQAVIPHLSSPVQLCDFLTRSYDIGGVISVMALSSLFILMTQHGLEYPKFYEKLYALLSPSIFIAKHRSKFFELVDSCLKSPLLPAYLAASFAKKLSRLSLSVPPSGALVIIALIHNLLRRHPSIIFLVHREDSSAENKLGLDKFCPEENDPRKTDAMRSSLWEIDTLRHHYCPPVSRFMLSLENDLNVRNKTAEVLVKDFSSGSYATIFREEIRRRVKQVPLAYIKAAPSCLFKEDDFAGWTFQQKTEEIEDEEEDKDSNVKRQRVAV